MASSSILHNQNMKIKLELENGHHTEGKPSRSQGKVSDGSKTSDAAIIQSEVTSRDGNVVFRIINQPEIQHRARYQTEGSRGAIKDKEGHGHPTVKLDGYFKQAKIQIFIGTDSGRISPHLFYQVCKVTGKHSSPCEELKINGTDVIEILADPANDNLVVCDCVGILKERFADVEQRFPKHKSWKNSKKKSTKCRMVFRTTIENGSGQSEILQVVSDVINCTQLPGTPEILKMSLTESSCQGGEELWIIGKNFMKDTKVVFSQSSPGKEEPLWTKLTEPEAEFFHATHLITKVPPFYNLDLTEPVEINVHIKCGEKLSDTVPFTFTPLKCHQGSNVGKMTNGMANKGSVSVITGLSNGKVIKNDMAHHHKSKKSKMDYNSSKNRRTRSVPRPNLIEEDTVFVTANDFKPCVATATTTAATPVMTSFSQFSWKDNPIPPRNTQSDFSQTKFSSPVAMRMRNSLSVSVDDESRTFSQDHGDEETTFHSPIPQNQAEVNSSLTRDFSGAFNIKSSDETQRLSFAGVMKPLVVVPTTLIQEPPQPPAANIIQPQSSFVAKTQVPPQEPDNTPNVSVTKSDEEKATISISLPTSILKDQKHFQSVIETINNTLLTKNNPETEESAKTESSPDKSWFTDHQQPETPLSPSKKITSMPVSVLSNARKRNISSELVNPQQEILSNASPGAAYPDHLSPISDHVSPYSVTSASVASVTSPKQDTQQETSMAQEKTWNAEFNQVLQSVIEQDRASGQMDWSATAVSTSSWTSATATSDTSWTSATPTSDTSWTSATATSDTSWTTNTCQAAPVAVATPAVVWTAADNSATVAPAVVWTAADNGQQWSPSMTVVSSVGDNKASMEWSTIVSTSAPVSAAPAVVWTAADTPAAPAVVWTTADTQVEWTKPMVATPVTSSYNVPVLSIPDTIASAGQVPGDSTLVTPTTFTQQQQQIIAVTPVQKQPIIDVQPVQQCISVPVQDFIQHTSPVQNDFSSFTASPAMPLSSNPSSVEPSSIPASDQLLFEDIAPIQGDPMLSESSSVIEIQKTIENAGSSANDTTTLGSDIPSDQQWVSTPQSSEWS